MARERLSQELQLFEHVYNRYSGPGENALLVEIAKRKHQLELAKLYEEPYDSGPEPCAYHEELIEQYESSTEELTEQRRTKEERLRASNAVRTADEEQIEASMHKTMQSTPHDNI